MNPEDKKRIDEWVKEWPKANTLGKQSALLFIMSHWLGSKAFPGGTDSIFYYLEENE